MKKNNFTLLEVLCAMVILAGGISLLMWQMTTSVKRLDINRSNWEQTHDLTQAAEFVLIHGENKTLDPSLFIGDYQVEYSFSESELKPENSMLSRRSLKKLSIQLIKDGEEIDSLVMDTFVEEGNHAN